MNALITMLAAALPLFGQQQEDSDFFKRWLSEDATYLITRDELSAARRLRTPEEKSAFIEQFWERRDPTPGTLANELREEHYRRVAWANEHYTTGTDGWRTDRGRMYIRFGKPDSVESSSQTSHTLMATGARRWTVPYEIWEYRNIPGIGPVRMTFVDKTMSGYYELTMNPDDKIAKFSNEDNAIYAGSTLNTTAAGEIPDSDIFAKRLQQYAAIQRPQEIRFKDLQEIVNVKLNFNALAYGVRHDVLQGIGGRSLVPVTFEFDTAGLTTRTADDGARHSLNVYGAVTSIAGRIVAEFEDGVTLRNGRHYQRFITLEPGRYKLTTVVRDPNSGNTGTKDTLITVSRPAARFSASTLILADLLVPAAPEETPLDNFVISRYKVRPIVGDSATRTAPLGIYIELYGFGTDPETLQPRMSGELQLLAKGRSTAFLTLPIASDDLSVRYNDRMLFARSMDVRDVAAGEYVLRLRFDDQIRKESVVVERAVTMRD